MKNILMSFIAFFAMANTIQAQQDLVFFIDISNSITPSARQQQDAYIYRQIKGHMTEKGKQVRIKLIFENTLSISKIGRAHV